MHGNYQVWTQGRVDELIERWAGGGTASAIGFAMKMTRSAVLGKVHRLGLPPRPNLLPQGPKQVRKIPKPRITKPETTVEPIIGGFVSLRSKRPPIPKLTKNQLRAQLTQAVINTARAK